MLLEVAVLLLILVTFFAIREYRLLRVLSQCGFPIYSAFPPGIAGLRLFFSPSCVFDYGAISKRLGPTFGALKGGTPTLITNDVSLIRTVCVTHFAYFHSRSNDPLVDAHAASVHVFGAHGARWKRMRNVISTAFSDSGLRKLYPTILELTNTFVGSLSPGTVEIHRLFQQHTSTVLRRCMMSEEKETHWTDVVRSFGAPLAPDLSILAHVLPEIRAYLKPFLELLRSRSPLDVFVEEAEEILSSRSGNETNYDIMKALKDVETEEGDWRLPETRAHGHVDVSAVRVEKRLTSKEIVAQIRFMSIAGFDTTANTLGFLSILLARHPNVQEKLRSEISTFDADIVSLSSLPYLNACIQEALRLFPHASPLQTRRCMEDVELADGKRIPKGVEVVIDTWSVHHSKEIWGENADVFFPERFLDRKWVEWMPFGVGPRHCVGMRFALMEIRLAIIILLQQFRIEAVDNLPVEMSVRDTGTVWPHRSTVRLVSLVS